MIALNRELVRRPRRPVCTTCVPLAFAAVRQGILEAQRLAEDLGNEDLIRRFQSFRVLLDNTISAAGSLLLAVGKAAAAAEEGGNRGN